MAFYFEGLRSELVFWDWKSCDSVRLTCWWNRFYCRSDETMIEDGLFSFFNVTTSSTSQSVSLPKSISGFCVGSKTHFLISTFIIQWLNYLRLIRLRTDFHHLQSCLIPRLTKTFNQPLLSFHHTALTFDPSPPMWPQQTNNTELKFDITFFLAASPRVECYRTDWSERYFNSFKKSSHRVFDTSEN